MEIENCELVETRIKAGSRIVVTVPEKPIEQLRFIDDGVIEAHS